jgi:chromosome partitioning protein
MAGKNARQLKSNGMAKVIAVYNQKGGCGKTATSMQLAGTLALRGYKVVVADLDPQGTASKWSSRAKKEPFPATVVSLYAHEENMGGEIEKMSSVYDFIIIDCPPAIESQAPWAALLISDLGIIPVIPVLDNLWASYEARNLGLKAQEENPDLQLRYLPTKVQRGNIYTSTLKKLREDASIKTLPISIAQRNAHPESQVIGQTVHSRANKPAIDEVETLTSEVLRIFGIKG